MYFGRLVDSINGIDHFLIKEVEESDLDLLLDYGFMRNTEKELAEEENNSNDYIAVYYVLGLLLFTLVVLIVIFSLKKLIVLFQARSAASLSKRGVESL